jgi:Ca-activated chloride channel family protein
MRTVPVDRATPYRRAKIFKSVSQRKRGDGTVSLDCRVNRGYLRADRKNVVFISAEVGVEEALREAGPLYVCLVIDRSGSMIGKKYNMAKEAAAKIAGQLRPDDYVSLVEFADEAHVVIEWQKGTNKEEIAKKIRGMRLGIKTTILGAATDLHAGLRRAFESVGSVPSGGQGASRIILLTDGRPTKGRKDEDSFVGLSKKIRDKGVSIIALGIGKRYNEDLLIAIASASDGRWYHITDPNQLPGLFEEELSNMKTVVLVRPALQAHLMSGAELSNVYRVGEMVTEVVDYQRENGKYVIPLEDVRAGSDSKIVFKVHVPPKPEGKLRIAKLAVSAPGTELTEDIAVESTHDQSRWGVETDPYPRALLTLAEATVVARQAVSDPTQVKRAQELVETVMRDPAAATEVRKDPSLMGIGSTVLRVTETVARGKLTEEDKKRLKQDATVIRK